MNYSRPTVDWVTYRSLFSVSVRMKSRVHWTKVNICPSSYAFRILISHRLYREPIRLFQCDSITKLISSLSHRHRQLWHSRSWSHCLCSIFRNKPKIQQPNKTTKAMSHIPHCFKMILSCDSSDLFLSWVWEWSSWDVSSFFSSSPWKTRQNWTLCFMVRSNETLQKSNGDNLILSLSNCLFYLHVSVQCLLSSPSPAWWAWPTLWSRAASSLASWASTYGRCDEPRIAETDVNPTTPTVSLLTPSLSLQGEPHLSSAYGVMTSYWEGVVHLVLFLTIIHRMLNG